jgi:predicted peroxiredoxin
MAIAGARAYRVGMPARALVVKCTTVEPEPCSQAFTVAATALAAGAPVSLWLTGDATFLATPGRAESVALAHAAPLAELRDAVLADGTVTVCTQCAVRRGLGQDDLLPGVRIAGAASFVDEVLAEGAQALVYGAGGVAPAG